jgi:virulence-associated protein VagC
MVQIADVIRIGSFRMVRLPPDLAFDAAQVEVHRLGPFLLLRPTWTPPDGPSAGAAGLVAVETARDAVEPIAAHRRDAANDRYLARGHLRLAA